MSKKVLLISGGVIEINRMRRYFDPGFSIKATSSVKNAQQVVATEDIELVIYSIGTDFIGLFEFYKNLRLSKKTADVPLIIIADDAVLKPLNDCVELRKTKLIGHAISREKARKVIYERFGEVPPEAVTS
ncbi:MAG: hypothetical protein FWH05_03525 [Oscillospiraceae bacterium]|nr:hypothetical protein [Oscillospiraceae bacterium]